MSNQPSHNKPNPQPPVQQPLDNELITKFLETQQEELRLRKSELQLKQDGQQKNFDFANKSLDFHAKDVQSQRVHRSSMINKFLLFGAFLLLVIVGMIVFFVQKGKDAMAMEIIKAIIYVASGGGIGYAAGNQKNKNQEDQNS